MATIWQARQAGWAVTLRCHRQREGLKSVRPCAGELKVHLSSLIAAMGPEVELGDLQRRLKCPVCGTDRVEIRWSQPPPATAGAKDAEAPRRQMRGAENGKGTPTLGTCRDRWIVFVCGKCGRRGEYKRETLLAEFDSTIQLPTLLEIFAHSRGCGLAVPNADPYGAAMMRGRQCLIRYDVEGVR